MFALKTKKTFFARNKPLINPLIKFQKPEN